MELVEFIAGLLHAIYKISLLSLKVPFLIKKTNGAKALDD